MFNAGQVMATLGGNFNPAASMAFDRAILKNAATMDAAESRMVASGGRVSKAHERMGSVMATAGKVGAAGLAVGVLAFTVGVVKSVGAAEKFQAKMLNVNTIAKISETRLTALGNSVQKLAVQTGQMPTDLADGLYDIVSSGFKADDALKILEKSSVAASAGLTTTAVSTKAVVSVLNAYGLGADKAGQVSDQLFGIVDRGVITFDELASQIGDLLPYAPKLGLSLDDLGGAIATITKGGAPAAEAMTQIKGAMVSFLSPSEGMKKAVQEAGYASGEALVKHKGLQGALEAIAKTTDGSATSMRALFPNVRALSAALALTGSKAKGAEADLKAMGDVSGKTAAAMAEQSKGYAFAKKQFSAALNVAGIQLGTGILPGLTQGVKDFTVALGEMSDSGQLQDFGDSIGHVLSSIGKNLPSIIAAVKGIGSGIGAGLSIGKAVLVEFYREVGLVVDGITLLAKAWNAINIDNRLDIPLGGLQKFHDEIDATKDALNGVKPSPQGFGAKVNITADATKVTAALQSIKNVKLQDKVFAILARDDDAKSKVKALVALGIPRKTAELIAKTEKALGPIKDVQDLMRSMRDKTVTVQAKAQAAAAAIRAIDNSDIKTKVLTIVGSDISASAKVKQIRALGIPAKTAQLLADASNALAGIASVRGMLASMPASKTVTLTTITRNVQVGASKGAVGKRAAGRGPGGVERSLVGEGNAGEYVGNPADGWAWVSQPTIFDLAPRDAVIPKDPAMSGRALGIMAAMLGIPGYGKGKTPKRAHLPTTEQLQFAAVPEQPLQDARDAAKGAYETRRDHVHDLAGEITQTQADAKKKGKPGSDARKRLARLKRQRKQQVDGTGPVAGSLAFLRSEWRRIDKAYRALHAANAELERLNTLQQTDATKMNAAAKRGDEPAWKAARDHRNTTLADLRAKLAKAFELANAKNPKSRISADLDSQLATIDSAIADAASDAFAQDLSPAQQAAQDAASRLADTGMTDAEQQHLAQLEASQSLAALTAPLDDDQAAAQSIAGFLSGILGEVQADPARGGAESVKAIADQLKQARDNVASFVGGGTANANPDLQAELDQANARLSVAQRDAQINAQALTVFQGWDGGGPGGNRSVSGPSITINTLHPGDPRTLEAIGNAATAGQGQQASRISPRTFLGV